MSKIPLIPPKRFKSAGVVTWVKFSPTPPPFIRNKRHYGRRAEGIRYEKKVHQYFQERFGDFYVPSPWLTFGEVGVSQQRWCQPDALLFDFEAGQITIIECKLQHTSDAWWQLKWLYHPVIAKAFPGDKWTYGLVEVTKWYDPATAFPEKVKLRACVEDVMPGEFACHILKP